MNSINSETKLVRAANFFALLALWGNPKQAIEVWERLKLFVNVDEPLADDALSVLGRLDVDMASLQHANAEVRRGFEQLDPEDLVVELGDERYPELLSVITDAPRFLFVRSHDLSIFSRPALAVVGTRHPTEDGKRRARKLAYLLAKRGIVVASGLAAGIDTAAHTGALDFDGATIGVIGTPLTRSYPKENVPLQQSIGRAGAVISQFHPSATTTRLSFPLRNSTMSGLSLGTIVVEAGETSGALIQADQCLSQGRKLFIPRSAVENSAISWPKKYLARGAKEFSTIEDLLEALERESLLPPQHFGAAIAQVEVYPAHAVGG